MFKLQVTMIVLILLPGLFAQPKPEIKFNGYIKTDMFHDNRQTVNSREGHFLLYPKDIQKDSLGNDLNDQQSLNILSIQTRLNCGISGISALGAVTSGFIEAEFFGNSDPDINGLRLRHAFVKMNWSSTTVLIGQYWHPMFITEVMPEVLSFNSGVPFQPFSRNPQIRLTQSFGGLTLLAAATMERDFTGLGPQGASSLYLRNSSIPGLDFQVQYSSGANFFAAGAGYKKIMPRTSTDKNLKTDKVLESLSFISCLKLDLSPVTFKVEGAYMENGSSLMMLGGYAVGSKDPVTGIEEYVNLRIASVWSELVIGKELKGGLFFGYSKNLGSKETFSGVVYSREGTIDHLLRVSPRISFKAGDLLLGTEFEYTAASYGKINNKGMAEGLHQVSNLRILFTSFYYFSF